MALSPEDVIKKSFSATHLRRGYDETQVDDFLDEVVVELRRLQTENEGLRTDLEDCRAGRGLSGDDAGESYQRGAPVGAAESHEVSSGGASEASSDDEVADLRRQLAECQQARAEAESAAKDAQERAANAAQPGADGDEAANAEREELRAQVTAAEAKVAELQQQVDDAQERAEAAERNTSEIETMNAAAADGEDPSSIISLAQRLHDQHVAEGESTKVRLIEEADSYKTQVVTEADERSAELQRTGQETHDRLVGEGQARHDELVRTGEQTRDELVTDGQSNRDQMIGEAEQKRTSVLEDLNQQQATLGGKIQGLHTQESELRERLRAFLTDQMEKLDRSKD